MADDVKSQETKAENERREARWAIADRISDEIIDVLNRASEQMGESGVDTWQLLMVQLFALKSFEKALAEDNPEFPMALKMLMSSVDLVASILFELAEREPETPDQTPPVPNGTH